MQEEEFPIGKFRFVIQFHEKSIKLFKLRHFRAPRINGEEKLIIISRKIDVLVLPKSICELCRRAII